MGLLTLSDLSGLGQADFCGPAPGLGPGEKSMCCPELGWVIYDSSESAYALCERASAKSGSGAPHPEESSSGSPNSARQAELDARRRALEARQIELEDRRFQQKIQNVILQGKIRQYRAAQANAPEARAARAARDAELYAAARSAAKRDAVLARAAAKQKKTLTYAAIAAVAAKLLFF